jgi:hypothetical protein
MLSVVGSAERRASLLRWVLHAAVTSRKAMRIGLSSFMVALQS